MGDLNVYVDGLPEAEKPEVRDHFREGERLQDAERHREAIEEYEKAFAAAEDDSQRAALHILIGNSYLRLSELQEAERHYRQAFTAAQQSADKKAQAVAVGNLGLVLRYRGDFHGAAKQHEAALTLHREIGNRIG